MKREAIQEEFDKCPEKWIRWLREQMGLSQTQLGILLGGAHQVTVARWETGAQRPLGGYRKALLSHIQKVLRAHPTVQLPLS